jgi:hypothetical protein
MRLAIVFAMAAMAWAEPRVDNVLIRMVPPDTTSLVGAHVDQIRTTSVYRKLLEQRKLSQLDYFAAETGFDPRRDVREVLFAGLHSGGVLLARGSFPVTNNPLAQGQTRRHGEYVIHTNGNSGFCVLDATLAVAGDVKSVAAALDEWKSGPHTAGTALLGRARQVDASAQFWGVSSGVSSFLTDNLPMARGGIDFSKILRGLENTWFAGNFTGGVKAEVHGAAATAQDAVNLRDAAKGLIGLGRLSVPENQPELLRLWDGFTVEQQDRAVAIRADIGEDLVDRLVALLGAAQHRTGR